MDMLSCVYPWSTNIEPNSIAEIIHDLKSILHEPTVLHPSTIEFLIDWVYGTPVETDLNFIWSEVMISGPIYYLPYLYRGTVETGDCYHEYISFSTSYEIAEQFMCRNMNRFSLPGVIKRISCDTSALLYYPLCDVVDNILPEDPLQGHPSFFKDQIRTILAEQEYVVYNDPVLAHIIFTLNDTSEIYPTSGT